MQDNRARSSRPRPSRRRDRRYFRQLCLQVCAWLSHALWQGAPSVVGHTRLQESFWLAQLARQASLVASARRNLPIETLV
jgi:hypothetical protein